MARYGRTAAVKSGTEHLYRQHHVAVPTEILDLLGKAGIRNYSIFQSATRLFSYFETDDLERSLRYLQEQTACERWQQLLAPLMDAPNPTDPWQVMDEVFHMNEQYEIQREIGEI